MEKPKNEFFKPGEGPGKNQEEIIKTEEELTEGFDEAWEKFKKGIRGEK